MILSVSVSSGILLLLVVVPVVLFPLRHLLHRLLLLLKAVYFPKRYHWIPQMSG